MRTQAWYRTINVTIGLALLAVFSGLLPNAARAACNVSGNVFIEAENNSPNGGGGADWQQSNDNSASGGKYLLATAQDTSQNNQGAVSTTAVRYDLHFNSGGTYYLWFRVQGVRVGNTNKDSLWYGLSSSGPDGASNNVGNSGGTWEWTSRIQVSISSGDRTIYVWPRESSLKYDGFFISTDKNANPNTSVKLDPTDPNCGAVVLDADHDGYTVLQGDCNDNNAAIHPGATEICGNAVDEDCDGVLNNGCPVDNDHDGHYAGPDDCNDNDASVYVGAPELCDNKDNNCDGRTDEGCLFDVDGDGYKSDVDCNDNNAAIHPGALEICGDHLDNNCDGLADEGCDPDYDGDGFTQLGTNGKAPDCNDENAAINPDATEVCDLIDNNCDGVVDPPTCDMDGDGYTVGDGDCNDYNPAIHPGALEICDGIDNNCTGGNDEGGVCASTLPPDDSGDVSQVPLFLAQTAPPLNMLVLGRDHKLYYEAYNDASDLNGDGILDVGYKPNINYYGYFDSFKCYDYVAGNTRFEPVSTTTTKKCNLPTAVTKYWSGDFLNYLTTSRMDALRKVLYGGTRVTDTIALTVLERANTPQDAHSWGKEYNGLTKDGYDIREYANMNLPAPGFRHLFANTTLGQDIATAAPGAPLLRVLPDSKYRTWEWVSIERPVAGSKCLNGGSGPNCENATATITWEVVPSSAFKNLTLTDWDFSSISLYSPFSHINYNTFVNTIVADSSRRLGTRNISNIDGTTNPAGTAAQQDYYLSLFAGQITVPNEGIYTFGVNGDDAVEVMIDGNNDGDFNDLGEIIGWYAVGASSSGHSPCGDPLSACLATHSGDIYLTAGDHNIIYRHEEHAGGSVYQLYWKRTIPVSLINDLTVKVQVCKTGLLEPNCKTYPNGTIKPTGLLHDYGENGRMKFGLLTGSYTKNTSGGVLRKKVGAITDEINADTGVFTNTVGIVKTIDRLRTVGFEGSSTSYNDNCGWITTAALTEGKCRMWGNPIAEMMYEGLRYFAGKGVGSSAYTYTNTSGDDYNLGLPLAAWDNPYAAGNNEYCAKPFELVISDINPSYDSDQLPGSYFNNYTGDITGLNVGDLADTIWNHEFDSATKEIFIGQSGSNNDYAPTAKSVNSFKNIRGLAPEEPTKQGSYYAASISYYGQTHDVNPTATDVQQMNTFTVALASPLPQIRINAGGRTVILVPYAKSVGGSGITNTRGSFQPTNQIVDYYVDSITSTSGRFRINFEDVEQGADHDMDAIAEYTYTVNADNTITVTVTSTYAGGGIIQHMGYVISGTTHDGVYLEVRDCDTANSGGTGTCYGNDPGTDPDYFLDTPPGQNPGGSWADGVKLPLTNTRTFTASSEGSAEFLKNPLWYAAKYGKFKEGDVKNFLPDAGEWDLDANGVPDNYFLVTNALSLGAQLGTAFNEIIGAATSAAAIATNSTRLDTDTLIYQARFNSGDWSGQLLAYPVEADGSIGPVRWDAGEQIPAADTRNIVTYKPSTGAGVDFLWANLDPSQILALSKNATGVVDGRGEDRLDFLRGVRTLEKKQSDDGIFRDRSRVLGDIVNSDPWFVGLQNFGYNSLPSPEGADYLTFRQTGGYTGRTKMLYFGANDGMLHGINATTGAELLAFVPNSVYTNLSRLTDPNYQHHYFVDGALRSGDVYIDLTNDATDNKTWKTVLIGSLGAGGKGIFALDVTNPGSFTAANVLWEIDPDFIDPISGVKEYADLGYTIQQPYLVRMANGKWAVVIGNGYNQDPTKGNAVLYIIDVANGSLIKKIEVDSLNTGNGLSGPAPVDFDSDGVSNRIVDLIYAGDLKGNMWKFDVSSATVANWDVAYRVNPGSVPKPLFQAKGPTNTVQPITARPEVGRGPTDVSNNGGDNTLMLYFGTGRYFSDTDNIVPASPPINSFYGIMDSLDNSARFTDSPNNRSNVLVAQTIDAEGVAYNRQFRITSTHDWDHGTKKGWYMDMVSPIHGGQGERVVDPALLNDKTLIFTTLIPSSSTCSFGGSGWLMEIQPLAGGRPEEPVLDVNGDGVIDDNDKVDDGNGNLVTPSGLGGSTLTDEGIITSPGIIDAGTKQYKFMSTSSGTIKTVTEANTGSKVGRGSWRQLR